MIMPILHSVSIMCICTIIWAQWKKGITVFDNLKRSKVNKEFLLPCKRTRMNFNSTQFQLLNFSLESLFDDENALLTFDLLGSSKTVIPFFHWARQLLVCNVYNVYNMYNMYNYHSGQLRRLPNVLRVTRNNSQTYCHNSRRLNGCRV